MMIISRTLIHTHCCTIERTCYGEDDARGDDKIGSWLFFQRFAFVTWLFLLAANAKQEVGVLRRSFLCIVLRCRIPGGSRCVTASET